VESQGAAGFGRLPPGLSPSKKSTNQKFLFFFAFLRVPSRLKNKTSSLLRVSSRVFAAKKKPLLFFACLRG
jgi:hypothetical protein